MMDVKEKQYEILGKALEIYRDSIDIEIDVNDFRNVVNSTLMAIKELENHNNDKNTYVNLNISTIKNTDDIDTFGEELVNRLRKSMMEY